MVDVNHGAQMVGIIVDNDERIVLLYPSGMLLLISLMIMLGVSYGWWKHVRVHKELSQVVPTVIWRPKFVNYKPTESNTKMKSSSITNILPRMKRLDGPYGMYGTVYGFFTKVLHIAHPLPAKYILTSSTEVGGKVWEQCSTCKSPAYDHFQDFSGDGVFTANGKEWKDKRSSVIHILFKNNSSSNKLLYQEANHSANSFLHLLHNQSGTEGNIVPLLQKCTIGFIYRYLTHKTSIDFTKQDQQQQVEKNTKNVIENFKHHNHNHAESSSSSSSSTCSTSQNDPNDDDDLIINSSLEHLDLKQKTSADKQDVNIMSYLQAVTDIRMIILAQSRSFWYLLPRWMYQWFSPMYKQEVQTMKVIHQFATMACDDAQPSSPLYQLQYRSSHSSTLSSTDKWNKHMLDEAVTLLFAGQDTSAATLSWTLHLLSLYPHIQQKLYQEVLSIFPPSQKDPFVTKKEISNMPYLDAVLKESMRLYPVAPFIVRKLPKQIGIPHPDKEKGLLYLPAETFVCIWIYSLHRNPALWHRPNDFVPERWIDPSIRQMDIAQTSSSTIGTSYMPFAAGPRNCVGQPIAHVILRIMLSKTIRDYKFIDPKLKTLASEKEKKKATTSYTNDYDLYISQYRKDMQAGFTVLPSGGVSLLIEKRTHMI